jgi:hypothetical protein
MAINSTLITTLGQDVYEAPGVPGTDEREYAVTCMIFCNYSNSDEVLDLWLLGPSPAAVTPVYKVINALLIPAGETFTFDTEKIVLSTGERVHAKSSNSNDRLTVTVSSMRVS